MKRYIDAEKFEKELLKRWITADKNAEKDISNIISSVVVPIVVNTPAEDVTPVIHAHWEYVHRHFGGYEFHTGTDEYGEMHTIVSNDIWEEDTPRCSNCGMFNEDMVGLGCYCSWCGAKMDEVV